MFRVGHTRYYLGSRSQLPGSSFERACENSFQK